MHAKLANRHVLSSKLINQLLTLYFRRNTVINQFNGLYIQHTIFQSQGSIEINLSQLRNRLLNETCAIIKITRAFQKRVHVPHICFDWYFYKHVHVSSSPF